MTSEMQRDIEVVDSLIRGVWGAEPYELEAWQRIRARFTPDRERVIEAVRDAYLTATSATDGVMLSEDYAVIADAAISAMGEP